jgi:phosphatidylglycerophosphate synthase
MKRLADGLTALRFVVALPMVWIALMLPPARSLAPAVWLTIVAWTSDWLDGPLARRAGSSQQTWLGRHDLEADLAVVLAQAVILATWGVVLPVLVTFVIVGGWVSWYAVRGQGPVALVAQGLWTDRKTPAVNTAPLQFATMVVYVNFMVVVWSREAGLGRILAGWLAVTVLLSPGRSWDRVRSFFVVMRRFLLREPAALPACEHQASDPQDAVSPEGGDRSQRRAPGLPNGPV